MKTDLTSLNPVYHKILVYLVCIRNFSKRVLIFKLHDNLDSSINPKYFILSKSLNITPHRPSDVNPTTLYVIVNLPLVRINTQTCYELMRIDSSVPTA